MPGATMRSMVSVRMVLLRVCVQQRSLNTVRLILRWQIIVASAVVPRVITAAVTEAASRAHVQGNSVERTNAANPAVPVVLGLYAAAGRAFLVRQIVQERFVVQTAAGDRVGRAE